MPSTDIYSPSSTSKVSSGSRRKRDWTRTVGYGTIAADDLPVNSYADTKQNPVVQDLWTSFVQNISSGAISDLSYPRNTYPFSLGDLCTAALDEVYQVAVVSQFGSISSLNDSLRNEALVQCLSKTADAKVNISVTLAEAHKTADMILSAANRIDKAYRAFRRGDLVGVAKNLNITPKKLHKSWLEYKYGWMPLLYDVKGSAEAFAQHYISRPIRFSVSAKASRSLSYQRQLRMGFLPGVTDHYQTRVTTGSFIGRVKIWLEVTNPRLQELQSLGLTNPLLVAWELVPFSFVFDWFISVGNYLQGLTALHGLTVRKAMYSVIDDWQLVSSIPARSVVSGGYTYNMTGFTWSSKDRHYSRSSISVNPLSLYPPVSSSSFGFQKMISSLALLRARRVF